MNLYEGPAEIYLDGRPLAAPIDEPASPRPSTLTVTFDDAGFLHFITTISVHVFGVPQHDLDRWTDDGGATRDASATGR